MKQDDENDIKFASIKANYPFGSINVENIEIKPLKLIESIPESKNKSTTPTKVIQTTTVSEIAAIGMIFTEVLFKKLFLF